LGRPTKIQRKKITKFEQKKNKKKTLRASCCSCGLTNRNTVPTIPNRSPFSQRL